jgi:spore coat polysaccharide biosynthesis protein SpsF
MKTVAIIQARMNSSRLPGKILLDLQGRSVLARVTQRVGLCHQLDEIIIATTESPADDPVVQAATELGLRSYRGSEQDVLSRYHGAALMAGAHTIVRITADCPLFDGRLLERMIGTFRRTEGIDYMSNTLLRCYPRGLDAEIFTRQALESAQAGAKEPFQREHVTPYFYQNPDLFKLMAFSEGPDLSGHRWTLDTAEDWDLISRIYASLTDRELFHTEDVLALFENHPDWMTINSHIHQKELKT